MKWLLFMIALLASSAVAQAHSKILYDIDLDFDAALKTKVTQAAQTFLGISEKPIQYDYDNEMIAVKFNKSYDYYAEVSPLDGTIYGFRDDTLISKGTEEKIPQTERKKIADSVYGKLPTEIRRQLRYGEEARTYIGTYTHRYYRYAENTYVSGDYLEVEIDPFDGDIVAWRLSMFLHDAKDMTLQPAISAEVAEHIALLYYKAERIDNTPVLVIMEERPTWITQVKMFYQMFVAVDGLDGHILFFGPLREPLPKDYSYGKEVAVVPDDFIMKMEGEKK